ncbi:hypothetical protein CG401_04120 [Bifidobacteriaceae bacterium NR019]|uniref:hypothetical protein n=1 Tax=Gardnerella TaxID=2701 RepID=UPI000E344323|nr:hypothetical protein CG404_01595 [Bifidobacteriaceae bacterium VN003]RFT33711.1 hypothetical protein CG401_04120 [Bifidobacteriaceae bacterium NR019]RFT35418.1 hypothetical protein CG400_02520 [Bifidobacteriaceae bacterium NR017]
MTNIEDASDTEGRPMRRPMRRLTLRSKIMRGVVAPFFALLAVLSVVLGVANSTFWKPSNVVIAYAKVSGTRYIVTDPGVLNLVDNRVRISVAALHTRKPICVAVGLTKDVRGWVAGSPVQRITGLRDWNNLSVSEVSGRTSVQAGDSVDIKDPDVKFQESNLWPIVTCQLGLAKLAINTADYVQSSGSASYDHAVANGTMSKSGTRSSKSNSSDTASSALRSQAARRVLLIDLGDNVPEASIELRWRRNQIPDFATPLYFVGALFAVLAILSATIFAMAPHRRRNKQLIASRSGALAVKSAQRDEVTFAEAISGTMSGIFGHKRHKKDSGSHARHGDHARRRKDSMQSGDSNGMQTRIASASTAVASTDSLAETTVIAQDEMLAFAARFMQQHDDNSYLDDLGNVDDEFNDLHNQDAAANGEDLANAEDIGNAKYSGNSAESANSENKQYKRNSQNIKTPRNKKKSYASASDGNSLNDHKDKHQQQNKYAQQNNKRRNRQNDRNNANNSEKFAKKRLETVKPSDSNSKISHESSKKKLNDHENYRNSESNKRQNSSKNSNDKQSRIKRNGFRGDGSNGRYRKNGKGYRGNSSSERGNE